MENEPGQNVARALLRDAECSEHDEVVAVIRAAYRPAGRLTGGYALGHTLAAIECGDGRTKKT